MKNRTLVIGASENPARYANRAIKALLQKNHDVLAVGKQKGKVEDVEIKTEISTTTEIDTVTLYINSQIQEHYEDFLIELHPRRVIFNPGTENSKLQNQLEEHGIETLSACTLVLLATNQY